MDCIVSCELLRKLEELSDIVSNTPMEIRERYIYYLRSIVTVSIVILCEMGTMLNIKKKCGKLHYLDYTKLVNRLLSCVSGRLVEKCEKCGILRDSILVLLSQLHLNTDRKQLHPMLQVSFKKTIGVVDSERARRKFPELCTMLRSFIFALYSGNIEKLYSTCIRAIEQMILILKRDTENHLIYLQYFKDQKIGSNISS